VTSSELLSARLPDGGPLYTETNLAHLVAEPFNATTAVPFLLIAVFWLWRLRGAYRQHAFLVGCVALLAVGGVGGTLFHAFRRSHLFYLMDVLPIGIITLGLSVHLWLFILPRRWLVVPAVVPFFLANRGIAAMLPHNYAISAGYAMLALLVLVPLVGALRQSGWYRWQWVATTVTFFATGLFFRTADPTSGGWLPIGTHWLWHSFSAIAVVFLVRYVHALFEWRRASSVS
jgi:hypothetical protein